MIDAREHEHQTMQFAYATAVATTSDDTPSFVAASGSQVDVDPEPHFAGFTIRSTRSHWWKRIWCSANRAGNELLRLSDVEMADAMIGHIEESTATEMAWPELSRNLDAIIQNRSVTHLTMDNDASDAICAAPRARTELGQRLREIRQRIKATGQQLLDWDALDRELLERRGEHEAESS